jgi:hypothetical protein
MVRRSRQPALAHAQMNLQKAYNYFFSGHAKFPLFKNQEAKHTNTTNAVNQTIQRLVCLKRPKITALLL